MNLNTYLIAIFAGVLVYFVMMLDAKYIEPSDKPISPKIPLFVTLLVWLICVFYTSETSSLPIAKQPAMVGGFYGK